MVDTFIKLLLSTGVNDYVATHDWVWPVCEILHFFGMAMLIGSVGLVDLRILGVAKGVPIKSLERFVPLGVIGLLINVTTGLIFVGGNPVGGPQEYLGNLAFQIKMTLILIAGLNVLVFYVFGIARAADATPPDGNAPTSAKFVAGLSLLLWLSVIVFGRYIMYNDTLLYVLGL
ncbi:MAG TPA: hypothetical protein VHH11_19980 [Gammaproteobacteria bacterium]|jgi:hypothetical protein|nr:hypothetical protein [Gammaproteobacteria bacterium]